MNLKQLVDNIKNDDEESIAELLNQFSPLVKCYAKYLDYEDGIQELNYHLIKQVKAMTWKNEGACKKFIKTVVYQKYLKLKIYHDGHCIENLGIEALKDVAYYDRHFDKKFDFPFEVLNKREAYIISKRYYENYSDAEIGIKMKISRQQVHNIRKIALKKLKIEMIKEK